MKKGKEKSIFVRMIFIMNNMGTEVAHRNRRTNGPIFRKIATIPIAYKTNQFQPAWP